jgi:hypothetical protein
MPLAHSSQQPITEDSWQDLASHTVARVALGRVGASLPTRETLRFALAHAQARDAVHTALEQEALLQGLQAMQLPSCKCAAPPPVARLTCNAGPGPSPAPGQPRQPAGSALRCTVCDWRRAVGPRRGQPCPADCRHPAAIARAGLARGAGGDRQRSAGGTGR